MKWTTQFVELDKSLHCRKSFDCGKKPLNQYLQTMASKHRAASINRTQVLPGDTSLDTGLLPICAYYTIALSSISRETLPDNLGKKLPGYPVPVYLIGQLAVNEQFHGTGLGKATLVNALEYLCKISEQIPAYAIIVDCLDDNAKRFYFQYGFSFLCNQNGMDRLFLPIAAAKKAISA